MSDTRLIAFGALAVLALVVAPCISHQGCASTVPKTQCLGELFGCRQCLVNDVDSCTWVTCDPDGCLEQETIVGGCGNGGAGWSAYDGPVHIVGKMQHGCPWVWDYDADGKRVTRFGESCYPDGDDR